MSVFRFAWLVAAGALAVSTLSGCDASGSFPAECTNGGVGQTPTPGTIEVKADSPVEVAPGETFRITVSNLVGYYATPVPAFNGGTLTLVGPVSPSGNLDAGFNGVAFPATFTFTATGEPGDTIQFRTVSGSSLHAAEGTETSGFAMFCEADALLRTIHIR